MVNIPDVDKDRIVNLLLEAVKTNNIPEVERMLTEAGVKDILREMPRCYPLCYAKSKEMCQILMEAMKNNPLSASDMKRNNPNGKTPTTQGKTPGRALKILR